MRGTSQNSNCKEMRETEGVLCCRLVLVLWSYNCKSRKVIMLCLHVISTARFIIQISCKVHYYVICIFDQFEHDTKKNTTV